MRVGLELIEALAVALLVRATKPPGADRYHALLTPGVAAQATFQFEGEFPVGRCAYRAKQERDVADEMRVRPRSARRGEGLSGALLEAALGARS